MNSQHALMPILITEHSDGNQHNEQET